jgi:membrane protease YdiL (CAAX protease family)
MGVLVYNLKKVYQGGFYLKKLLINIFKTLFFFDLAVISFSLLPTIKTENSALLKFSSEGFQMLFIILLTAVFIKWVEKKSIKLPSKKKKFKQVMLGLFLGIVLPVIAIAVMIATKSFKFEGINAVKQFYFWIPALLFNAITTEYLLRGYLFQLYKREYGVIASVVLTTLLYISLNSHIFKMGKIYMVTLIVFNILLCILLEWTSSMVVTISARFFYSLLSTFVLGSLSLSGGYPALLKYKYSGSSFITGGANGIEGSIIPLGIIGICFAFWAWKEYKPMPLVKNLINKIKNL